MPRFNFIAEPALPKLAWCARITAGSDDILVEHGPWVETHATFFIEGAWNGDYSQGNLSAATMLLGSGGELSPAGAVFCSTTHTKERLQSLRVDDALLISNSFIYLLRAVNDGVDPNYRFYERDFMTSMHGVPRARKSVPTMRGRRVTLHYNEKLNVDRRLNVRSERYADGPSFSTYEDYVAAVDDLLDALTDNANAGERRRNYRPLATISTGYDSPAATVFAQRHGCNEAITFAEARPDYNDPEWNQSDINDSGAEIADHLRVAIKTFRRDDYHRHRFPEAEFIATGNGGDDVVISIAEDELAGTMLYTGFLGDILWDCQSDRPHLSRDYAYKDPSGASLSEFRLRVGFIHIPVPLLTFTRHPDLHVISRSPEMARWRIGGDYDRPVPRRLVESRGVPRHLYGQCKKAITQPIWLPVDFRDVLLAESYADLEAYTRRVVTAADMPLRTRLRQRWSPIARQHCMPLLNRVKRSINWQATRLERITGTRLLPPLNATPVQTSASILYGTPAGLKFHWAVDKVLPRYAASRLRREAAASQAA